MNKETLVIIIQILTTLLIVTIIALIIMLISSLPAIGAGIIKLIGSLMPVIVVIAIFWYIFKSFFKKK